MGACCFQQRYSLGKDRFDLFLVKQFQQGSLYMSQLPAAPDGGSGVTKNPSLFAFTYICGECQRCHLAVGGKQRYGDFRGFAAIPLVMWFVRGAR